MTSWSIVLGDERMKRRRAVIEDGKVVEAESPLDCLWGDESRGMQKAIHRDPARRTDFMAFIDWKCRLSVCRGDDELESEVRSSLECTNVENVANQDDKLAGIVAAN